MRLDLGREVMGGETYGIVCGAQQGTVASDRNARYRHILLGNQLMGAVILSQVPDADTTSPVAADNLSLIRVNHDVVGGASVIIAPLDGAGACFPDLDSAILGARDHPFALAVERDAGNVACVAFKGHERIGIRGLDVVKLDGVVAGGGEEALVWRDA